MSDPFAEPSKYDLSALGYSQQGDAETNSLLPTALTVDDDEFDSKDEITKEF